MRSIQIPHSFVLLNIVTYDATIRRDIRDWLLDTIGSDSWHFDEIFRFNSYEILFNKEEDAMLFKMRWY